MSFQILVQLKGGKTDIYSPTFESREDAEADLAKIKDRMGKVGAPDVTWMAANGPDILGAHVIETGY